MRPARSWLLSTPGASEAPVVRVSRRSFATRRLLIRLRLTRRWRFRFAGKPARPSPERGRHRARDTPLHKPARAGAGSHPAGVGAVRRPGRRAGGGGGIWTRDGLL